MAAPGTHKTKVVLGIITVTILVGFTLQAEVDCGTVIYNEHITNVPLFRGLLPVPPTAKLLLNYKITIPKDHCCPIAAIDNDLSIKMNSHRDESKQCFKSNLDNIINFSHYYIDLHNTRSKHITTVNGSYVFTGTRRYYMGTEAHWWILIAHRCRKPNMLNIHVELELQCTFPTDCEDLISDFCRDNVKYDKTCFPNTLGGMSQRSMNGIFQTAIRIYQKHTECYKYTKEFICYSFFPKCEKNTMIIPCQQTCIDATTACNNVLERFKQPIYCGSYPASLDPSVCFYNPVTCPQPEPIENGVIKTNGNHALNTTEYVCDDGYKIKGEPMRHCLWTGHWNGSLPRCVAVKKNPVKSERGGHGSIHILALIIIIGVVLVLFLRNRRRREVQGLQLNVRQKYNDNIQKGGVPLPEALNQQIVFITYSSEDRDNVEGTFLPDFKREIPQVKLQTFSESFLAGEKLLASIWKGIWESDVVLALLTHNYMRSEWCRYEFAQGQTRSASDRRFKFIIILYEDEERDTQMFIESLPQTMRTWVKTRVYLRPREQLFWEKLRRGLAL